MKDRSGLPDRVLAAIEILSLGSWVGAYMSVTWLNRGQPGNAAIRPGPP